MRWFVYPPVFAASVVAGTTDDRWPDSMYVSFGKQFEPFCLRLSCTGTEGTAIAFASAVPVAPQWALTAAHVVEDAVAGTVGGVTIDEFVVHPDFEGHDSDIALVHVERPFEVDYFVPLSAGEEVGETVLVCGYGIHGPLSTGYASSDGELRAGTNTIDRLEGTLIVCAANCGSSHMEFCIAPGDSGGPLFVGSGTSARLAGINSMTSSSAPPLRSKEGEESGHTRVSLFREWIGRVIGGAR